jgi:hypothetical protein
VDDGEAGRPEGLLANVLGEMVEAVAHRGGNLP